MALEASHVTRQFLRKRGAGNVFNAVDDVTLTIQNGKIVVITGPSGSGKSTLLNMMAGILVPTSGTIAVDGTDLYSMDDEHLSAFRNTHIGVVPQGQTAIHSLDVLDNVLLPYVLSGDKKGSGKTERQERDAEAQKRAEDLLEKTGIRDLEDVMPSEMSGGELRRMAIARAMMMNPDVILADEPTADLDEENTSIVLELMRFAAEEGSAVLIVTHDRDVFSWADEVHTLKEGRLDGSVPGETDEGRNDDSR